MTTSGPKAKRPSGHRGAEPTEPSQSEDASVRLAQAIVNHGSPPRLALTYGGELARGWGGARSPMGGSSLPDGGELAQESHRAPISRGPA